MNPVPHQRGQLGSMGIEDSHLEAFLRFDSQESSCVTVSKGKLSHDLKPKGNCLTEVVEDDESLHFMVTSKESATNMIYTCLLRVKARGYDYCSRTLVPACSLERYRVVGSALLAQRALRTELFADRGEVQPDDVGPGCLVGKRRSQ